MEMTAGSIVGAAFIGALIGIITGVFGVGGGFMLTPLLMICLGVPAKIAVGTGLATICINSAYGMYHRKNSGTIDIKLSVTIAIGSFIGVILGSMLLNHLSNAPKIMVLGREQDTVQYVMITAFLVLLCWIAGYLYYDYKKHNGIAPALRVGLFSKLLIPPVTEFKSLEVPELSIPVLIIFGCSVGVITGMMGVSGVILLPGLVYLVGQRTVKAAGTSLLLVFISSAVGVIKKCAGGDISLILLITLLVGGLSGTWAGTKLGLKFDGPKIRLYFIYIVILAAVIVAYKLAMLTLGLH